MAPAIFRNIVRSGVFALVIWFAVPVQGVQQSADSVDIHTDERFRALAWIQNSAEYRLLAEQTFRLATQQLQAGLCDTGWSADEVQSAEGGFSHKPPAVILDVDETILDNSAYNARNIMANQPYKTKSWDAWCAEEKSLAIPGALEFVKAAEKMGVRIFFVTNRRDIVKQATINNLNAVGFPANSENVLTKNADAGRAGDKVTRRATIARDYRIVLLIGDSMSDLCFGMDADQQQRNQTAGEKTSLLGTRWIIMPNPVYGGWQRALPNGADALRR